MHAGTEPSDEALMLAFRGGDSEAFVTLVERHHAAIERFVRHSVGARPEVDDILQETFLDVVRAPEGFSGTGSFRGWLLGIARHKVAHQFRRRSHEPENFEPVDALGLRAGWGDPELDATLHEREALLHAGLAKLSVEAREVLVLRDIEGLSNAETASVLGLALNAVKSRLHRARLALLAEIRAMEVGNG